MSNTTDQVTTAQQLSALPDNGMRYELVDGVLHMMSPAGGRHGRIAATLLFHITKHVRQHGLGVTFAAETGFLLQQDPDTVRAPDVAFVSHDRLGELSDHPGFLPITPDLVAEVVSPSESSSDVESKARSWLDAGVRIVLVVDPQATSIRDYRPHSQIHVHTAGFVDLNEVLPGLQLDVVELFA